MDAPLLTKLLMDADWTSDWTSILDNDVDTATVQFINAIHLAAAAAIPTRRQKLKSNQ